MTLPVERAQAAIVRTGPVRDAFGWRELKLQSLARDEGGKRRPCPGARSPTSEEVGTIVREIGWRWPPQNA